MEVISAQPSPSQQSVLVAIRDGDTTTCLRLPVDRLSEIADISGTVSGRG